MPRRATSEAVTATARIPGILSRGTPGSVQTIRSEASTGFSAAVSTLLKIMVDPNAPASSRVRAAETILEHTAKAIEIEDVEARVAALEQTMKESKERA
jgi:hypothetical protein